MVAFFDRRRKIFFFWKNSLVIYGKFGFAKFLHPLNIKQFYLVSFVANFSLSRNQVERKCSNPQKDKRSDRFTFRGCFLSPLSSSLFLSSYSCQPLFCVYCSYLFLSSWPSLGRFETSIASRCVIEAWYIININWLSTRACARINKTA